MSNCIVTYETQHGSAKRAASMIAEKLGTKFINIDTPFEAENLSGIDHIVLVFNFRGPYTAQLTKLYLNRVKNQLAGKSVYLVGEGLFSEQEFPVVAKEIHESFPSQNFDTYFIKGQLRVGTLYPEEKALLSKFSQITKMEIKDMGEFDAAKAAQVAREIADLVEARKHDAPQEAPQEQSSLKWVCPVCKYEHFGAQPPETCPLCGVPGSRFEKVLL